MLVNIEIENIQQIHDLVPVVRTYSSPLLYKDFFQIALQFLVFLKGGKPSFAQGGAERHYRLLLNKTTPGQSRLVYIHFFLSCGNPHGQLPPGEGGVSDSN